MNYAEFQKQTNKGWNTWYSRSVLTHAYLPHGFAINLCLKDLMNSALLREAFLADDGGVVPGERSWDGSYTSLTLTCGDSILKVESTAYEDEQIILITPQKIGAYPLLLAAEACLLWNKEGAVFRKNGQIWAEFSDGRRFSIYTDRPQVQTQWTGALSPYLTISLDMPSVISTIPCTAEKARCILDTQLAKLHAEAEAYGSHAEAYTAMKTCLAWNTIYDPDGDRIISPVSRQWSSLYWGGYVLFEWDTYFSALLASLNCRELAFANAIAITHEKTEDGLIPNFAASDDVKSRDRSQPPVGSMVCLEIYKKYPERWFLQEVYPTLLQWNRWFFQKRMLPGGYLGWGSNRFTPRVHSLRETVDTGNLQGAVYESGLDNSPMYDEAVFDETTEMMQIGDVGLMGLYIHDCRCLMEIAEILGEAADVEELRGRMEQMDSALMTLWSSEDEFFENLDLHTGKLSPRVSPTNFYSLFSSRVSEDQKSAILRRYFYNPDEFWGEYMLPSITRRDPGYPDQNYWRGRIWAPMNYLVYEALKSAGLGEAAQTLANKSEELLLKEWRLKHHVHENYNCDSGLGCDISNSDHFYHWGGLLAYIAIDAEENV